MNRQAYRTSRIPSGAKTEGLCERRATLVEQQLWQREGIG
jgi:hypothetical protein